MTLRLLFLRHARAVSRADWYRDDSERPLTERGREDAAHMADFMAKVGIRIEAIVSSPYVRAFDTAEVMARRLNMRDELVSDPRVAPGFDLARLEAILDDHPHAQSLMFVGHEPDFSSVLARLVGGRITMKKGGLAYVEIAQASLDGAALVWLVQPSVLGA